MLFGSSPLRLVNGLSDQRRGLLAECLAALTKNRWSLHCRARREDPSSGHPPDLSDSTLRQGRGDDVASKVPGEQADLEVSSEATSKIALERPGAEVLSCCAHLAAQLGGEQGSVVAQAQCLLDQDVKAAAAATVEYRNLTMEGDRHAIADARTA